MIEKTLERWHRYIRGEEPGALDDLLHDDCTFYSPVVFSPQQGKAITKLYLQAASQALPGESTGKGNGSGGSDGGFRYVKEVAAGNTAMLEFETSVGGKYVNGIDLITCDDDGRIVEFKVLIRPLQAVNAVHASMGKMLEAMKSAGEQASA